MSQCSLTTQAQRPGARDARIATATLPPGSLQRMVRPRCHGFAIILLSFSASAAGIFFKGGLSVSLPTIFPLRM